VNSRAEPFREHARAKWGDRIRRFVRTMKERGEYRWLLHASEYGHLHIVELKSVRATNAWLCEISR
jgi:hypothetical protein